MRKALVILFVVAALGILATYVGPSPFNKSEKESASLSSVSDTPVSSPVPSVSTVTTATPTPTTTATPTPSTAAAYKDGSYTGDVESHRYGDVQISIKISGGKITDVSFLRMPDEEDRSYEISEYAKPRLKSQTLSVQNAQIAGVSGATFTSMSYRLSLQSALDKAKS